MSRIRSQLDSILAADPAPSVAGQHSPRPAYPASQAAAPSPFQPAQQGATRTPEAYAQPPVSRAPAPEIEALHQSLEQLSRKIASMPKPDAYAPAQTRQAADADRLASQMASQSDTIVSSMGQVVNEIRTGFTGMRQELNQTAQSIHNGISNSLSADLQRISDGIAALQQDRNMHPDYVEQMQAELTNLNAGITHLLDKPASQVDLSGVTQAIETNYSDLVSRLDLALTQRGDEMPALDIPDYSGQFASLNDRLEEMTRAVVSLTVNPDNTADHHAFERIEARLASLSKAVDELGEAGFHDESGSAANTDTIAAEIARLSEKLDNLDAMGAAGETLGQDIFPGVRDLADRIDRLQNDIGVVAANLEKVANETPIMAVNDGVNAPQIDLAPIEQHLAGLAARMDELAAGGGDNPNADGQEIITVLRDLVGRVEGLEQIASGAVEADPSMDPAAERFEALEKHLTEISNQLGGFSPGTGEAAIAKVDLAPITERLDHIEGQIATSRDIVIDIATEAAQRAVASGAGSEDGSQALAAMMEEIRAMRAEQGAQASPLPADNDQLAEIGSTMAAIADRLARMETLSAQPVSDTGYQQVRSSAQHAARNMSQAEAAGGTVGYASAMSAPEPGFDGPDFDLTGAQEDPLPHIQDAPSIDLAEDADFSAAAAPAYPDDNNGEGIMVSDAQPVDEEDVPLAPGSGMPDLESLVQRATRKKKAQAGEKNNGEEKVDDGLSDLMAAARRAAQAASLEAETAREAAPKKKTSKLAIGNKLSGMSRPSLPGKKTLMMSAAAIAVIAGGLFVSQSLFGGSGEQPDQVSGLEAPLDAENSAVSEEVPGDTAMEDADAGSDVREVDLAEGSTLMSPEVTDGEAQVIGSEDGVGSGEDVAADEQPVDESAVQAASIPVSGELPSEELGNTAFRQAVAAGNGDALFEAGKRYTDGQIVPRDLSEAVKWYTRAAESGHAPAQYRLGNFYEKGHGVEANPTEAVKWYEKAAAQGNALAMHNLAVLNAMGVVSGDADMPTAVSWFEKAADLGVKDSQVNLGILFTKGMGVEEDLERAYKWFAIAAKGGDADAAKKRDTVAQAMRPEQLEKARGEAEIWKPAKLDAAANVARVADEWKPAIDASKLTKAELVKLAQEMLTRAGFDAGPADGMMGEKTRNAIAAFQEANGLPVDGTVSQELMQALSKKINI